MFSRLACRRRTVRLIPPLAVWLLLLAIGSVSPLWAKGVIGGDLLRISVDESPDLNGVYTVAGDGTIDFNYAGRVVVEGKTVDEVAAHIQQVLEASYFKRATVQVDVSEYFSGSIMILGAVRNPGTLAYKGNEIVTLLEALIAVGGMTERAASDQVKIFRWKTGGSMEREVINVDIKRIMAEYDFSRDQYLRPRDIVVVPEMGQQDSVSEFLALGEFGQTGFHPVTENMNMIRAVSVAGGVSREAHLESARVLRPSGGGNYTVIPVDFARLFGSADMSMNLPVFPGDIIYLPSLAQTSGGKVYFLGEVDNPGMYPLPVNRVDATLARTILQRGGLGKFSNGSAIRVQRKSPDGSQQTIVFDVERIIRTGDFDKDIPLQDEDVILVPRRVFSF
ncbi:MAG TPA: SLBB domain-containing protein [Kiritimatiellia bacterium]|nr:SLBB domain-containing protein [Kiritimatiellia bacterium]HMO98948.1 SLBB domain-containing protein [Kiritimatiellia bacterium]HMP95720.1 SLBB domain-containing protein [Kiritimatiellia bacterium]